MSDFKQTSFSGGLNLLLEDSRLPVIIKPKEDQTFYDATYNQYRIGSNIRTRFDVATPTKASLEDGFAPAGLKQGILTFGNYIIIFVAGDAYYRLKTQIAWTQISGFSMSTTAPRVWTIEIPLATTNYFRLSTESTSIGATAAVDASGVVKKINQANKVAGTFGNIPGLLVQDGVNQPQFMYIDNNGIVQCRTTQTYNEWQLRVAADGVTVTLDKREYVPIGTFMEWFNGILFIVSQDRNTIYRSVSGRPLDFMVNVDADGQPGGDATTTSYSVGVGGITALRAMPGNSLFVAAGGASTFSITLNQTPNAPTIFGEYTFNRATLFNANCITERGIVDISGSQESNTAGDSVFIDANGLRSFNAILQQQNEGRNSIFSSTIHSLFNGIVQRDNLCAAINFDNFVIFSVLTIDGYKLIVYDTLTNSYTSVEQGQVGDNAVKQFAVINIDTLSLFCITSDNKVYELFGSSEDSLASIRLGAVSTQDPKREIRVGSVRVIFTNITKDFSVTCYLFTNNRFDEKLTSSLSYVIPVNAYNGPDVGSDIDTQTNNILFTFTKANQGWKSFIVLTWTGGASLATVSIAAQDFTPLQPPLTQAVIKQ